MPVNANSKYNGGFRLNKNHKSTNLFHKNNIPNQINNNIHNIEQIFKNKVDEKILDKKMVLEGEQGLLQAGKTINIKIKKK